MAEAVANSEPFRFGRFFTFSCALHAVLVGALIVSAWWQFRGNEWAGAGGGGDSVAVNLVTSPAGLPMPKPPTITDSKTVDPAETLNKAIEQPKPPPPPPDATKVPEFKHEKPLPPSKKSKTLDEKKPNVDNAVPGHGGTPNIPTGYGSTPGKSSGLAMQGQGGGDFSSRYGWYVDAVKRRIQQNWLQNTIDPGVRAARSAHAVVQFTIYKDGTVKDIKIYQTSTNSSMDNSGLRAVMASSPMPSLPPDYSGSYVTVLFDFDLSMNQ